MSTLRINTSTKSKQRKSDQSSPTATLTKCTTGKGDVSTAQALQSIEVSLQNINKRLDKYDNAFSTIEDIKSDIYDTDGLEHRVNYTSEQSENNAAEIYDVRAENEELQKEIDLLRSVIIRMDRKMDNMEKEITDLRGRSMRDNILIHHFEHHANENLMTAIPAAIKQQLGVDVNFVRIHRNGSRAFQHGRPITITGKLQDGNKKDEILRAQKSRKAAKVQLPFYITPQEPAATAEERRRLYQKSDSFRKQNTYAKVVKNQIIMPNGRPHEDEVPKLSNADILQVTREEKAELEEFRMESTLCEEIQGSQFFAMGAEVKSVAEVKKVYKKSCLNVDSASSDHRVLVYRFKTDSGDVCESYHDDGEHGAGRRIMKYLTDRGVLNVAVVITRRFGGSHIGYERFNIMERLTSDLLSRINAK